MGETKQECLHAALALWSEKGYANTSMRELARRAGIGLSALYAHFPSPEHLVQALYDSLNDQAIEQFEADDAGEAELAANIERLLEIKLELLGPHREALVALFREAVDPQSPLSPLSADSSSARDRMVGLFEELVCRTGIEAAEAKQSAKAIWLGHLIVLAYWLHDRSGGENTRRLMEKFSSGATFLPMLAASPQARELMDLLAALIPAKEEKTAEKEDRIALPESARESEVVIIGGGPIGLIYASWLKLSRPSTSVLVLEREEQPGHKIGESTLSGFCKALRSIGIPHTAMQRLFYPKNGLGFFHVNGGTRNLAQAPEYILETFDETFQVERRPLEILMIANARRLGVEVIQGAAVDIERSKLSSGGGIVAYKIGSREFRTTCKLLVDASGPTGVLGRQAGQYSDDGLPFQTSSVWGYFRNVRRLQHYRWPRTAQFSRDQYTQHLCFKEGWLWYIPLVSWQASPQANLQRLALELFDPQPPAAREELIRQFGCPAGDITSIGLTLRSDRDDRLRDDPRAAFEHYRQIYPAIGQLLEGAELLEDHYGLGRPFSSRVNFRRFARQAAGEGWLLLGDAAFFVDPLISPGLTGGTACAYAAVQATLAGLESGQFTRDSLAEYESFVRRLHDALERDNQLVYMSFNHPVALELVQRFQEIDARRHFNEHQADQYNAADTNVWGILSDGYQRLQQELHHIMREEEQAAAINVPPLEQTEKDYQPMVVRMRECLRHYLQEHADLTPYLQQNASE